MSPTLRLALSLSLAAVVAAATPPPALADAPRPAPLQAAAEGPRFSLRDADGRSVSAAGLAGRPYLLALGFTHCPDVCPDTLQRLAAAMALAGGAADRVAVLFVSVDPERDTPQLLRDYVGAFDPRILAATGSPAALAALYRSLDIRVTKQRTAGGYTMDHPLQVYMVDGAGRPAGIIRYIDTPEQVARKIRQLAGG